MNNKLNSKIQSFGELQQSRVISLFSLIGMSITAVMSIFALFQSSLTLFAALSISSCIFFAAFCMVKWRSQTKLSSFIIIYLLYILMFYLIYTGGVEQTGPLWIFIVPPVSVYVHGLKQGSINIALFVFITWILMFNPEWVTGQTIYAHEFKLRLFYSFITISFLSALYEYSRTQLYHHAIELNSKLHKLAHFDELTELRNRRSAQIILEQQVSDFKEHKTPFSVLLCDLDYFKQVNDKYGHNMGDKVLTEIAKLFRHNLRETDYVSRWGGEEFLFILTDTDFNEAYDIAERIRTAVSQQEIALMDQDIKVTMSVGVQEYQSDMSIDQMINLADKYLYEAKRNGRNRVLPHQQ
ncbi:GGDEF domain-containing protein [Shewanella gaetbuli]|uniref:diguanylate cyclase n=1 Tax=Shewanella gaetbuli TaxID=220752 RepID=A0A9X1ZHP4_9GAMM|nr:GGDEF domain-containing protein [Shewanella gaetbuli]MCL1142499.1 GGDEF domain-containing protein [Shewanella gaetbuli]